MSQEYTYDWISGYWPIWERLIPVKEDYRILEIGCFEGRSTVWFLEKFPNCDVTCIDTFEGGLDHKQIGLDFSDVQDRFTRNTAPYASRVTLLKGESTYCLSLFGRSAPQYSADIILVDGSHVAKDVLADIVLSWPLLKPGGTMILDDREWGKDRPSTERPEPAIDAFLACYFGEYELLEKGYQVIVRKR